MFFMSKFRSFRGMEEGNATIEFVLLFPAFIFLFLMGFEGGYYMVRNVMLERAVDVAIRDVRLGGQVPTYIDLKASICKEAAIIQDCSNSIMVEIEPVTPVPGNVTQTANRPVRCIDQGSDEDQQGSYSIGQQNQAMLVRVCTLSKPLFPTTGIGVGMQVDQEGNYAIVTLATFVNEPGNRAFDPCGSGQDTTGIDCDTTLQAAEDTGEGDNQ